MSRRKWCREHVSEIKENCGLTDHEVWRMERANDFEEAYPRLQICNLTTDALEPLMKRKNQSVESDAVEAVVKMYDETHETPTRKDVEQVIAELRKVQGLDESEPDESELDAPEPEPEEPTKPEKAEVIAIAHANFEKGRNKWRVTVQAPLGRFDAEEEAHSVCGEYSICKVGA